VRNALESRIDRFALQREHAEHTFVNATEWFALHKALESLDTQRKFPKR
jgi:hypothetical protein